MVKEPDDPCIMYLDNTEGLWQKSTYESGLSTEFSRTILWPVNQVFTNISGSKIKQVRCFRFSWDSSYQDLSTLRRLIKLQFAVILKSSWQGFMLFTLN